MQPSQQQRFQENPDSFYGFGRRGSNIAREHPNPQNYAPYPFLQPERELYHSGQWQNQGQFGGQQFQGMRGLRYSQQFTQQNQEIPNQYQQQSQHWINSNQQQSQQWNDVCSFEQNFEQNEFRQMQCFTQNQNSGQIQSSSPLGFQTSNYGGVEFEKYNERFQSQNHQTQSGQFLSPPPALLQSYHSDTFITYNEPDIQLMKSGYIIQPPPPPPPRTPTSYTCQPAASHTCHAGCSSKITNSIRKIGNELESMKISSKTIENSKSNKDAIQEEDRPLCIVCCEELQQIGVGQCNHTLLCIMCAVRMRMFYRNTSCPLCKADCPEVICTNWKDTVRPFAELRKTAHPEEIPGLPFVKLDLDMLKERVVVESRYHRGYVNTIKEILSRLGLRSCPACKQVTEFFTFKDLSKHLMVRHGQYYCFVCQKAKRQFPCELDLFSKDGLNSHFETHPKCEFCNNLRYFSAREQRAHYQEEHYQCHICERMGFADMWLEDVDDLLNHMRANHFTCEQCGDTVGFSSKEELQTHQQSMHNNASSHFNVGVDVARNELRIQLRGGGGQEENIDGVRENLVMLLNYFREMFGSGEHNGFIQSIEDVMIQFQMQVGMDTEGGNLWRLLIAPPPPPEQTPTLVHPPHSWSDQGEAASYVSSSIE